MRRSRVFCLFVPLLPATLAGCSSGPPHVADPFKHGVAHARVLADEVLCGTASNNCTRYVVVVPDPGNSAVVRSAVERVLTQDLGLTPSTEPPIPPTEGDGFAGRATGSGAFVNTAGEELQLSAGDALGEGGLSAPPDRSLISVMRQHPGAVVVRLLVSTNPTN